MKTILIALCIFASTTALADERGKAYDAASRAEYKVQIEVTKCNVGDCSGLKNALKEADKAQAAVERADRKAEREAKTKTK